MKFEDLKFDKRLIDRNIKKGLISKEELETYLKNLPDLRKKREFVNISDIFEEKNKGEGKQ